MVDNIERFRNDSGGFYSEAARRPQPQEFMARERVRERIRERIRERVKGRIRGRSEKE